MRHPPKNMSRHKQNVDLWEETHDANAMLLANLGLVWAQARQHAKHMNRWHLMDDYDSAAATGFLQAFAKRGWDHKLGALGTFVGPWMLSAMQRYVDKPQGTYGIMPSNAIVSGGRDAKHMPVVGSLEYAPPNKEEGERELGKVIKDPAQEYELERVDEVISAKQDVSRLLNELDDENKATMNSMLNTMAKHGTLSMQLWAMDEGVSANTMYNRMGVLARVLRTLHPDLMLGAVPLGSDQAWVKYVVRSETGRFE